VDKLSIKYNDGNKAFVEQMDVCRDAEEQDISAVVDFSMFKRAIDNCQPSGSIKIDEVQISVSGDILKIDVEQKYEHINENGEVENVNVLGKKTMDIKWVAPDSNMKSSIVTRMDYDALFQYDGIPDEYDRKEFVSMLGKTSVEKGRYIYVSKKNQSAFVVNTGHVTDVSISSTSEISSEEIEEIEKSVVAENGALDEQKVLEIINSKIGRVHYSLVMNQAIAKSLAGMIGRMQSEKIYVYTNERICTIFTEEGNEKVAIWFVMPQASRVHLQSMERYNALGYKTYNITFIREFIMDNVKTAMNVVKSGNARLRFNRNSAGITELVISASSSMDSVADEYKVLAYDCIDSDGTLCNKEFEVSLSTLYGMLEQLKTQLIAFDIDCNNPVTCIRLAEIDSRLEDEEYKQARYEVEQECIENCVEFNPEETPTPIEKILGYRKRTLKTKQYAILGK
jgi:Fe2+ or Zn2+ uptake regulation protein